MLKKIFNKSENFTNEDLKRELLNSVLKEKILNRIVASGVDINWQNSDGESFLHLCAKKNLILSMQWLIKNNIDKNLKTKNKETALFYAVNADNKEATRFLIDEGFDTNCVNKYSRTPLQEAVILNSKNVIELLLKKTKKIDNLDIHRRHVMFDAVSNGDIQLISKVLQNKELNLNQIDVNGDTILHQKSVIKNDDLAIKLIEAGADPSIEDAQGKNYLFHLARKGISSALVLKKVIEAGYELNCTDKDNRTLLMDSLSRYAKLDDDEAKKSMSALVQELIHLGIDVNAKDKNGENALFIAVKFQDEFHTRFLLEKTDIDVNEQNNSGETVLSLSIIGGVENLELIKVLLEHGSNPEIKDQNQICSLEKLINRTLDENINKEKSNYFFVLNAVLDNSRADVNNQNSQGQPFLFDVIFHKDIKTLKLLKQYNLSLDIVDTSGNNVIHDMIKRFRENRSFKKRDLHQILTFLITLGVDVNATDTCDRTVLHNAIVENWEDIVKLLLDYKADINAIDERGRSLVHCCVWKNDVKNFKLLHAYDLTVLNIPDKYGILPINYAAFMGYKELVVCMIEAGAYVNNTELKHQKIVDNLSRHRKNLDMLLDIKDSKQVQRKISLLVENMKKEFELV